MGSSCERRIGMPVLVFDGISITEETYNEAVRLDHKYKDLIVRNPKEARIAYEARRSVFASIGSSVLMQISMGMAKERNNR